MNPDIERSEETEILENTDAMRGVIAYNFGHNTWYNIYGGGFKLGKQ